MSRPGIQAIIFDIGRVLVRVDVRRVQLGLAQGQALTPQELWSAIEKDPHWHDWHEGRMSPSDWHRNLTSRFAIPLDFDQFTAVWSSPLDPEPMQVNSLFESLSKQYRLGLLSNTDPIHVARLESTYEFFRYFPESVRTYSCSVGWSKPDPRIYQIALRKCLVEAEQAVYIDDIPAYVRAAQDLGMHGIHFQNAPQLAEALGSLGISPDS